MNSFFAECYFYLILAGPLQTALALLAAPIFIVAGRRLSGASFCRLLLGYGLFNVHLLFWGCLGNYLFFSITFDRLYVSADYVADWFPFIPFGQWVLDRTFGDKQGYLIGTATLWELRLIWFAVAAPVWWLAYACTRKFMNCRLPRFLRIVGPTAE